MKSRKVEHINAITEIINKCDVCYMGMIDQDGEPYVLPFNFGFDEGIIYLHSAKTGKKIDILRNNNRVCVAFSTDHVLRYQNEEVACSWSMKYRSVLAYGTIEFIDDPERKVEALNHIMKKYAGKDYSYNKPAIEGVQCFRIHVKKFEGRAYGY